MKKQIKKFVVLALAVGMLATSVLGTSAAFDPVYYAAQNPDVVKALGNSPAMLKLHYDMFGRKEARMSNKNDVEGQLRRLFNADDYAKLFPDVKKAFGNDKEAMFNHYIAFGLLEGRRPSEKVSQATASSLKKTVEKAMKDAGLAAKPGSPEVVAAITGETSNVASAGGAAVKQTIAKVADVVAKEVTATVEEVQNPKPAASSSPAPSTPAQTRPTIIAYRSVSWNDPEEQTGEDSLSVSTGDPVTTVSGNGTKAAPYEYVVEGVATGDANAKEGVSDYYYMAIAVPNVDGREQEWFNTGADEDQGGVDENTWYNATGVDGGNGRATAPDGHHIFILANKDKNDGEYIVMDIALADGGADNEKLSAENGYENATYYRIYMKFASDE